MTETLALSVHAVDERSLRIPSIAADLLPVEVVESRRTRTIRRAVLGAIAGFTVVLAAWYALALYETSVAQRSLARAEDNVKQLNVQQKAFAGLISAEAESKAINDQLSSLLADDLQWSHLFSSVQGAAPSGVNVTGVSGALASDAGAGTTQIPGGSGEKPIGTLTLTGTGTSKAAVAAYVDALAKVPGVSNPLLGDVAQQKNSVAFTVHLDITKTALGGRYAKKKSTGK